MNTSEQLIDLDHLDRYVSGDVVLRDEILQIFVDQADMWTSMLDPEAVDTKWRDAAHALKGAARGVGAWEVGDICAAAEEMVGQGDGQYAERCKALAELREKVRETVEQVRELRERSAG